MAIIRRCLVHGDRPERIAAVAKELVARDAEVLAPRGTSEALLRLGVPVLELPSFTETSTAPHDSFQLLDPRVQAGLAGDWSDRSQVEEFERQGVKRIDLLVVDLPEASDLARGSRALESLELGGVAALRAAARNHRFVVPICDLSDFDSLLAAWDSPAGEVQDEMRFKLARKALQVVGHHDSMILAAAREPGAVPASWSVQLEQLMPLAAEAEDGSLTGFYGPPRKGDLKLGLRQLTGKALTASVLRDVSLAWSVAGRDEQAAVAIVNHSGLCGFARGNADRLGAAFAAARAADPRGSFGGVAAFNRQLDPDSASAISAAFLEAVAAPSFSAEAQAELGRTKTRLLRVDHHQALEPLFSSTVWGVLLSWPAGDVQVRFRTVSGRSPAPEEEESLRLAWMLVCHLQPVAVVVVEGSKMVSCSTGQTSWRDAARVAMIRLPAGVRRSVAACANPIRFADDVALLADGGVSAVLQPAGSPRQSEIIERVDRLGMVMQIVEKEEAK